MKLRDYQTIGSTEISRQWASGNDVLKYVLATGGGKTVLFVEKIKELLFQNKRIMLIAHRSELIDQAWATLYANKIYAGIIKAKVKPNYELPVQVCSIQTIINRDDLPPADVLIFDESHHVLKDNSYGSIIKRYMNAQILMVTATPYRLSGEGFKYVHPYKETKLIMGRTVKQLIDEGWLVPFEYYVASIPDLKNVHINKGDYDEDEVHEAMKLAPLVDSYLEHAKGKRGVCFCVNVAHSLHTVEQYLNAGITAAHLDANTPTHDRRRILADFKAGLIQIICNVGIITEGFDFPDLEFVQLAAPTKSLSKYLQEVGRGTRPVAGIVDGLETAAQRKAAIARSAKPHCIVLDNAGLWQDHSLPDEDHNWEQHFNGTRGKKKVTEEFEMLVYVAQDENGRTVRTNKVKEIEGLKLVRIDREIKKKMANLKSLKEFDAQYAILKRVKTCKKPGYVAFQKFQQYCNKHNILMVEEIWDYLELKLVKEIQHTIDILNEHRGKDELMTPAEQFIVAIEKVAAQGISKTFFKKIRQAYEEEYSQQLLAHRLALSMKL